MGTLHRCAVLNKDNGKHIVPYHTGRIAIGGAYVPKQRPVDAQWIERHRAPGYGMVWWLAFGAVAFAGVVLVVVTR